MTEIAPPCLYDKKTMTTYSRQVRMCDKKESESKSKTTKKLLGNRKYLTSMKCL